MKCVIKYTDEQKSALYTISVCKCVYVQETCVNQESHMYQYSSVDCKKGMPSKWCITRQMYITYPVLYVQNRCFLSDAFFFSFL